MAVITSTTRYEQTQGAFGFPAWIYTGLVTNDSASIRVLEAGGIHEAALKLVYPPNSRELIAMSTDGTTIVAATITPNGYDRPITDLVKIIPGQYQFFAGTQPTGADYAGQQLLRFAIKYQQIKLNRY